jgi:GH25 family lysozyme M1 (1,4-beta-N-acetylmuramidase)
MSEMNATHNHTMGSTLPGTPAATTTAPRVRSFSAQSATTLSMGMDVSAYQTFNAANWAAISSAGVRFVYVKATEGTDYVSSQFGEQYGDSYNAGMYHGAYHFATPNTSSGASQANYFVNHGGGWTPDGRTLPPMLDIEYNPYGAECYGLSQQAMRSWLLDFANTVLARTGTLPSIYTTTDWWSTCTGNTASLAACPLFIARWGSSTSIGAGTLPAGWTKYTFWQWSSDGSAPGANGPQRTDQDVANGGEDFLRSVALAQGVTGFLPGSGSGTAVAEGLDGVQHVFWRGQDGNLWQNIWTGQGWVGPYSTGAYIGPGTGITAGVDGNGDCYVFWRGGDGAIWQTYSSGSAWAPIQTLPTAGANSTASTPSVSVTQSGLQYVFWKGSNGDLTQTYWDGRTWNGPSDLHVPMGNASAMSSGVDATGATYVFWRGDDQGLQEAFWTGTSWSKAQVIPTVATGSIASSVGVAVGQDARQYVFWRGSGDQLYQTMWTGRTWTQSAKLPAYLGPTSGLTAGVDRSGSTTVFWQGGDSGIWEAFWGSAGWSGAVSVRPPNL